MFDYVNGKIVELCPTDIVVDCNGVGFHAQISLQTYENFENVQEGKVYLHHILREDEELFYGFFSKDERELFRLLIGVSGVGPGTARIMLSSLTCNEIREAIIGEDLNRIKSIKGIGLKTAQRLILELKDKVVKGEGSAESSHFAPQNNANTEEAVAALGMLGFRNANVTIVVNSILKEQPAASLETIIKLGLKRL